MAIEAGFDWVYLESEFSVRLSVVPDLCRINMDLVWILDQSGSVGRSNHGLALQFINNVHNFFEIGLDRTRVGMVTYSTRSRIAFDLNDHTSRNSLRRAVNAIRYPGGYTRTAQALAYARFLFNDNNNRGVRPVMDGIPRVAVLITDGKSNLQPLGQEPQKLKDSGVVVYSVGIGNIDLDELLEISSDPDQLYVYLLRRYSDASNFVDLLGATLCESPAIVITGSFVLTRVGRAEFKYFQTICGQFTRNTTIIVEVRDRIGFSFVYVSTAIPNPGPVSPRPYTVANTNAAFKRTRRLITVRFHAEFTFTRTVYISVEGTENTNEFELTVYEMLFNPDILEVTVTGNSPPPNPIINVRDYLNATGSFRFSITEGNEAGRFTVDESTGEIRAKAPLNPAEGLLYNLTVVAENTQDMCQRSRAYVVIMVTAGNDNTPVFQPLTPVSIPETTPNDVSVAVVTATDADAGTSGQVTYSIESGNTNSVFNIHEDSGVISVSQNQFLNRSMYQAQYMLGIVARDGGDPQQSAMATQTVNVQDVNEPPFFTTPCARNSTCVYMVSEGASPTDVIGDVMADDVDPGTNGEVTYSITRSSGSIGLFNVNNEGRIIVGQELNFDGEETTFLVEITVRDGGNPSLSAVTEVTIEITDVNDNPPTITVTSPVSILESATGLVATVVADDPDTVGGPIQFSLTGSSLFRIDISSGEITLTGPLDYETQTQHTVTVTATDGGGMSSSAVIVFNVIDENDNSPIFYGNPYQFMLTEEQVLTDFGSVFANDSDSGSNAQIKYSIQTSSTPFTVDQQSGSLSSSALDRESTDFHDLIVVATDCGTPPRSSQAVVRVTVLDINDNPPTFQRSTYHREYREDISVPRDVVVVMATDRDQPNTDNSRFVYSVSPSNNFFDVDQTTGQVRLVLPLDYEAQQVHNVTIVATDMGQPPMNGSAVVIVTVLDVNDNIPSIVDSLTVNISELAQPGTRIAQFTATDVDANSVLTYSIVSGNDDNLFTVNTTSGLVSLLTMLDYETQQMHRLNVSVKDQGGQGAFGTLVVNVINENDNTPEISAVATFDVDEETPVSTSLFTVTASDADLPPYNSITFSISSSPLAGAFSISDDGNVTIATVIDRENLRRLNPNDEITVVIVASDGELSSMATVTIRVQDINDNPPIFTVHSSSLEFNEEQMSGTTLTTLTATDADIGLNAQVVYSIQGDSGLPFVIGNTSGVVMATRPLDREAGDVQFMFSVVAMDRGSPSLSAITNITVQVVDINDNRPLFNQTLHQVTIPENTPTGQTVVRLFAEDADQGSNGEFEYRILSGNQDSTFNISDSGIFKTNRELDFERRQFYAVTIAAVDMGTPALTGTAVVEVTVENIDESPPGAFGPCTRTLDEFTVPEGGRVPIIDCPATDFDDGRVTANPVTYAIVEVNGDRVELNHPFTLDRRTSLLSAVRDIDFEAESNWTLLISATDSSDNVAFTYIYVIVRDINDNVPTFINGPFRAFYRSVAQTNIFLLEAEDLDTGLNGLFEIYRVGFSQRGNTSVYDVTFNATDFGTPRLTGTVNLEVNIDPDLHPCLFVNFTVDHAPNTTRGFVRIQTLCSFTTQPSSANLILGQNHTFMCAAQGNLDISYRWIHNGSAITSPSPSGELALSGIEFQEAGQYACVASSSIGSLQSGTVTAIILVAPVILNAPTSVSVELDRMVRFWCVSEGNPDPTNAFTHTRRFVNTNIMNGQDGGRILVTQNFMLISSVVEEDDGDYRCTASSIAGTVTSEPAHLFIFGISNLISITVEEIQSPDSVGQCQAFNPNTFADSANQASGNQLEMHIINSTGDNICNQSACSPNPCLNGGACIESNITGFTCNCLDGWEGTTCQTDIDECVTRGECVTGSVAVD
jgi:protocadherin Fat 4